MILACILFTAFTGRKDGERELSGSALQRRQVRQRWILDTRPFWSGAYFSKGKENIVQHSFGTSRGMVVYKHLKMLNKKFISIMVMCFICIGGAGCNGGFRFWVEYKEKWLLVTYAFWWILEVVLVLVYVDTMNPAGYKLSTWQVNHSSKQSHKELSSLYW